MTSVSGWSRRKVLSTAGPSRHIAHVGNDEVALARETMNALRRPTLSGPEVVSASTKNDGANLVIFPRS
jgi:hypothetical protein